MLVGIKLVLVIMVQHSDTGGNHDHIDDAICKDNDKEKYDDAGADCSRHRGSFGRCGAEHEPGQGESMSENQIVRNQHFFHINC